MTVLVRIVQTGQNISHFEIVRYLNKIFRIVQTVQNIWTDWTDWTYWTDWNNCINVSTENLKKLLSSISWKLDLSSNIFNIVIMISGVSVILFNNVLCLLLHYIPLVFQFSGRQRPEKLHRYSDSHLTLKAKLYIYSSQKRFLSRIVQKRGGWGLARVFLHFLRKVTVPVISWHQSHFFLSFFKHQNKAI